MTPERAGIIDPRRVLRAVEARSSAARRWSGVQSSARRVGEGPDGADDAGVVEHAVEPAPGLARRGRRLRRPAPRPSRRVAMNRAASPSAAAAAWPASTWMSATTTRAPSSTKRWAVARPMPLAPPVMTATCPSRRPAMALVSCPRGTDQRPAERSFFRPARTWDERSPTPPTGRQRVPPAPISGAHRPRPTSFFTDSVCTVPARRCDGHRTGARRRPVAGVELPGAARRRHPPGAGGAAASSRRGSSATRTSRSSGTSRGSGIGARTSGCGGGCGSSPAARSTSRRPATTSSTRSSELSFLVVRTDDRRDQGLPQRLPAPGPAAEGLRRPLLRDPLPVPRLRVEARRPLKHVPARVGLPPRRRPTTSASRRARSARGPGSCSSTRTRTPDRWRTSSASLADALRALGPGQPVRRGARRPR